VKIIGIDVYQVMLPYSGDVYRLSGGRTYSEFDSTIVRVRTDKGVEGWGESTPFGATYIAAHAEGVRAALALLAPAVLGHDPRCVETLNTRMDDALAGHLAAKTAIDVACWDIFGKSVGMPVCDWGFWVIPLRLVLPWMKVGQHVMQKSLNLVLLINNHMNGFLWMPMAACQ